MKPLLLFSFLSLLLFACTKTPQPDQDHYFNFRFNDTVRAFTKYPVGNSGLGVNTLTGKIGDHASNQTLRITISRRDEIPLPQDSIRSFQGRTFYLQDSTYLVDLTLADVPHYVTWTGIYTQGRAAYIKIDRVTFLRRETTAKTPCDYYLCTGSCSAFMKAGGTSPAPDAVLNGEFKLEMACAAK